MHESFDPSAPERFTREWFAWANSMFGEFVYRLSEAGTLGEVLDKADLRRCDMPYLFFRPQSGVRACVKAWLEQGGTHHEVIVEGVPEERVRLWCRLAGIEFVRI